MIEMDRNSARLHVSMTDFVILVPGFRVSLNDGILPFVSFVLLGVNVTFHLGTRPLEPLGFNALIRSLNGHRKS